MARELIVDGLHFTLDVRPFDLHRLELPGLMAECDRATFDRISALSITLERVPCRFVLDESFIEAADFEGAITQFQFWTIEHDKDRVTVGIQVTSIGEVTLRYRDPILNEVIS
jgi:hypothetical protein